ncbi:MAG: hypothetical protein GX060_02910 [Firmicutes bacterium]|nr:hypothetical protein [Bacillota bacterium]
MVTSCKWQQLKVITPQGDASKVVYLFSQVGRQQMESAGQTITTTFSTSASRLEFITIKEALLAQRPPQEEELTAQFLRFEDELLEGAMKLAPPFHADNIAKVELIAAPFIVFYFSTWEDTNGPVIAVPVSLFNGLFAPKLLDYMRQFPLTTTGLKAIIAPNFGLAEAFAVAAAIMEVLLANEETGRSSLAWCDTAKAHRRHRSMYREQDGTTTLEDLQWDEQQRQVLGLQPVEYLSPALILVPKLIMTLREPVQDSTCGILDPILESVYLMARPITVVEN